MKLVGYARVSSWSNMRKILIALTLCIVLIGAVLATSAVSATNTENTINPSIRQYNILDSTGAKIVGKITIDGETGHYIVNVNLGRAGLNDAQEGQVLWILLSNDKSFALEEPKDTIPTGYGLLIPSAVNAGGIGHVEWTYYLIQQWFGGGAVDQTPTDARFYCFDCV